MNWKDSAEAIRGKIELLKSAKLKAESAWPKQCMATTVAKKRCGQHGNIYPSEFPVEVRLCKAHAPLLVTPGKIQMWAKDCPAAINFQNEILKLEDELKNRSY